MDTADPSQELIGLNQLFVFLGVADQGSVRPGHCRGCLLKHDG